MAAGIAIQDRWQALLPADTVVVDVQWGIDAVVGNTLDDVARGGRVAIVGGRQGRRLARKHHIRVESVYVALPSLRRPAAVAEVAAESLRWFSRAVLTVPPGEFRLHGPKWAVIKLLRHRPGLLARLPIGDRIVIGVRR